MPLITVEPVNVSIVGQPTTRPDHAAAPTVDHP
jgi:hypothetical protein